MRPEAPTRLDRAVLAFASGRLGHLLGTALEIGPVLAGMLYARLRARLGRRSPARATGAGDAFAPGCPPEAP